MHRKFQEEYLTARNHLEDLSINSGIIIKSTLSRISD
jgi:hypothetical protein